MAKSRLLQPLGWYTWNPSQWQGSRKVQRMDWACRGIYRELMDECWLKGSIPSSAVGIAEMFGCDSSEIEPYLDQLRRCFDLHEDGAMTSPFIEELRTEADARRVIQANRRLGKTKNGEPRITTDNQSEPEHDGANRSEVVQTDRQTDRQKPLTPSGRVKKGKSDWMKQLDPEAVEAMSSIKAFWHDPSTRQPDGKSIPATQWPEVARRLEGIKAKGASLNVCIAIAERYVAEFKHGGMWTKAAQNFFGLTEDAPFKSYYQAHLTNEEVDHAS